MHGYVRWIVLIHADSDSRRHSDLYDGFGNMGVPAALDGEESHPRLWAFILAASLATGAAAEELDRRRISDGCGDNPSLLYTPALYPSSLETASSLQRFAGCDSVCGSMAYSGDAEKPALPRIHIA
jgi:hypothetical protein